MALTTVIAGGAVSAPVGAAPVGFTLTVPEGGGELSLRGSTEPTVLGSPTTVSGTIDDQTGALSPATFATPTLRTERPVTQPVEAVAVIDATFSPTGPGATTGSIDSDGNLTIQSRLVVDLHVEVFLDPSLPPALVADCRSTPVVLTLESVSPYVPDGGGTVTVADENFTIPAPANVGSCNGPIYDALQDELTGPGHAVSMTLNGTLPLPEPPGDATTTTLAVDPAGQSRLGQPLAMTATVAPGPDSTEPGTPGGLVDFLLNGQVIGTETLDSAGQATFTTDPLPSGTHTLTARYKGQTPFRSSPSPVIHHLVAPDPTITTTLPEYIPLGGDETEFDLVIGNSTGGAAVATPGISLVIQRLAGATTLNGLKLERLVGADWVEVPLTVVTRTARGEVSDPTWAPLEAGEQVVIPMRLSAPTTVQAGPLSATFDLVDDLSTPESPILATSVVPTNLIAIERQPSTITAISVLPTAVRQGNLVLLRNPIVRPVIGGVSTGKIVITLDGQPLLARGYNQPLEEGFGLTVPVATMGTGITARVPVDARAGSANLVAWFLGSDHLLPSQNSWTIEIVSSAGPAFECSANVAGALLVTGFNLIALAGVPAIAPAGSRVSLANPFLRALLDRGTTAQRLTMHVEEGGHTVGDDFLRGITLDLGAGGSGSATGYVTSNTTQMTAPGDPDLVMDFTGETASMTIDGAPGDVVPVELQRIVLSYLDPSLDGGLPYDMTCTPLGGPVELGRVTVAGTTLSVGAPSSVRVGDAVALSADVVPGDGTVEFFAGATSLGVARVVDGRAVRTTEDIPAGDHVIVARHTSARMVVDSNAVDLTVLPRFDCEAFTEEGNGAVVRLVYLELLGRCPDQAGFDYWMGRLDAGASAEVFARTIARTPEAVGRVVDDAYETMLGRPADLAGRAFWVGRLQGHGRYDALLADLGASGEFWSKAGSTNDGFVARVYDRLLNRAPDVDGRSYWVGRLDAGGSRRALI